MGEPPIIDSDLVLFLTHWYREWLAGRPEQVARDAQITNREPSPGEEFPPALVVIRDDGGVETSFLGGERTVGFRCLAGSKEDPKPAMDLARLVHAARYLIPAPDVPGQTPRNPVAAVLDSTAPVLVDENEPQACGYVTVTFAVVGEPL